MTWSAMVSSRVRSSPSFLKRSGKHNWRGAAQSKREAIEWVDHYLANRDLA